MRIHITGEKVIINTRTSRITASTVPRVLQKYQSKCQLHMNAINTKSADTSARSAKHGQHQLQHSVAQTHAPPRTLLHPLQPSASTSNDDKGTRRGKIYTNHTLACARRGRNKMTSRRQNLRSARRRRRRSIVAQRRRSVE